MNSRKTPFQRIRDDILRNQIIPKDLIFLIPKGWKRVGSVLLLELKEELLAWKNDIGQIYLRNLSEFKTVMRRVEPTSGQYRQPKYEILAGINDTHTVHKELNTIFHLNAATITFASGNHHERLRMLKVCSDNEIVVDMFACVGNLSLPLPVHYPHCKVFGVEINPEAFSFLTKNVKVNKVDNRYIPIFGDNRERTPKNVATRVIMGYFGIDDDQLKVAINSLDSERGGVIHVHGTETSRHPESFVERINEILERENNKFTVQKTNKIVIKSLAAGVYHFVEDITLS